MSADRGLSRRTEKRGRGSWVWWICWSVCTMARFKGGEAGRRCASEQARRLLFLRVRESEDDLYAALQGEVCNTRLCTTEPVKVGDLFPNSNAFFPGVSRDEPSKSLFFDLGTRLFQILLFYCAYWQVDFFSCCVGKPCVSRTTRYERNPERCQTSDIIWGPRWESLRPDWVMTAVHENKVPEYLVSSNVGRTKERKGNSLLRITLV